MEALIHPHLSPIKSMRMLPKCSIIPCLYHYGHNISINRFPPNHRVIYYRANNQSTCTVTVHFSRDQPGHLPVCTDSTDVAQPIRDQLARTLTNQKPQKGDTPTAAAAAAAQPEHYIRDIKIIMAIILVMTVTFVIAVYCIFRNGCNINVYCFIGYNDYNCLNGL